MAIAIEKKFDILLGDVHAIQKALILSKMQHIRRSKRNLNIWNELSLKISMSWDSVPAIDEIASQREKQW